MTDTSKMSTTNTPDNVETPMMTAVIDDTAGSDSIAMTTTTDAAEPTSPPQPPVVPSDRPESVDHPESGGPETGVVVGLVLGPIILLLVAVTASLFLLLFHKKRCRKQDPDGINNSGLDNPNYGKSSPTQLSNVEHVYSSAGVDTVKGARYTKSTEAVKVYSNPGDDEYAIPDIAQHYETVSEINIM